MHLVTPTTLNPVTQGVAQHHGPSHAAGMRASSSNDTILVRTASEMFQDMARAHDQLHYFSGHSIYNLAEGTLVDAFPSGRELIDITR